MRHLTKEQRHVLALLCEHERRVGRPLEPGDAGTYSATWQDYYTTGVHWSTAEALERRGLVTIDRRNCAYDEPADLFLTDAGRARAESDARRVPGRDERV